MHRQALLTWAVVYPLITALLNLLDPVLAGWPIYLRTLLLTLMLVPLMVYIAMPLATRALKPWLANDHTKETIQ